MTARTQLGWLVEELDDDQAERALMVLESSAEWILTGELAVVSDRAQPARRDHHRPAARPAMAAGASGRHSGY